MQILGYELVTSPEAFAPEAVAALMAQSYWAPDRSLETIARSMEKSDQYGLLDGGKLVAYGRVLSDHATVFWLCDVIVDEALRGRGLGKALVAYILERPIYKGCLGVLATKDAQRLYARYGFRTAPDRLMLRPREENT
jgi:GNAT superfamily N-acetyltransferase